MNALALPLLIMLACMLAELYFSYTRRGVAIPWREVTLNFNSGHILMLLLRGVEILVFAWVFAHFSLHWVEQWPPFARWAFAIIAWDLGFYWMHRLHHTLPVFWSVHVVHHEGEHFNLSLGIRNAWLSSLTTLPFTSIPLAIVGVPLEIFIVVSTLHYTVQFYNHNSIVKHSGWLEHFFITPAHHRIHHGCNPEYRDHNFGGTLLIWDRLFGTFQRALPDVPVRYGVARPIASANPLWVNIVPLLRYAGWREPRLTSRPRTQNGLSEIAIGIGGLILFCAAAYYLHRDGSWSTGEQPAFFAVIFCATLALGGLSDGRSWGLPCWLATGLIAVCVMPWQLGLHDTAGLAVLGALALHGMVCAARRPAGQLSP
jgi:sterol desaturase/sphingolipid hydroxylase (fatty acid hydroxylase superfamily)